VQLGAAFVAEVFEPNAGHVMLLVFCACWNFRLVFVMITPCCWFFCVCWYFRLVIVMITPWRGATGVCYAAGHGYGALYCYCVGKCYLVCCNVAHSSYYRLYV